MKILITGAAGQLGRALVAEAGARGWEVVGLNKGELDITDAAAARRTLGRHRPEVLVNAAAWGLKLLHLTEGCWLHDQGSGDRSQLGGLSGWQNWLDPWEVSCAT